jgi:hypothetical protein
VTRWPSAELQQALGLPEELHRRTEASRALVDRAVQEASRRKCSFHWIWLKEKLCQIVGLKYINVGVRMSTSEQPGCTFPLHSSQTTSRIIVG